MRKIRHAALACALASLLSAAGSPTAATAELRVLGGSAIEAAMRELIPAFERQTGHSVSHDFDGAIGQMAARVRDGERADVVIVSRTQINDLIARDMLAAGSN